MIPALPRIPDVDTMIERGDYFLLHAPPHSGKSTCLAALTEKINSEDQYYAIHCSLAPLRFTVDVDKAMDGIFSRIILGISTSSVSRIRDLALKFVDRPYMYEHSIKVRCLLTDLCRDLDRELVLLFDDADCVHADSLVLFLAQIKGGFNCRFLSSGLQFPKSLALVGLRDIRDCLYRVGTGEKPIGLASDFNIIAESLTLANFSIEEIRSLYDQHAAETGQAFEPDAVSRVWYWTEGQPWIVNALADNVIFKQFKNDYSKSITAKEIDLAVNDLFQINDTHLDVLAERIKLPRVRMVIESVLAGSRFLPRNVSCDDKKYVIDHGLLKMNPGDISSLRVSNPIYGELIVRTLTRRLRWNLHDDLVNKWTGGTALDMDGLIRAFQVYWHIYCLLIENPVYGTDEARSNKEEIIDWMYSVPKIAQKFGIQDEIVDIIVEEISDFTERDIPYCILNAFLEKAMGEKAECFKRDLVLGRDGCGICVICNGINYPLELIIKDEQSEETGLENLCFHMEKCGAATGWLIVADMDSKEHWKNRSLWETLEYRGKTVQVVYC
ncbi:MAG: hypothetical protein LBQ79_05850 [Deltaproteobacteria bacterium]|jgi:hypothetical protein|nr:hypothetical protein [Deltaproteobacteria bacterium]